MFEIYFKYDVSFFLRCIFCIMVKNKNVVGFVNFSVVFVFCSLLVIFFEICRLERD